VGNGNEKKKKKKKVRVGTRGTLGWGCAFPTAIKNIKSPKGLADAARGETVRKRFSSE